MLWSTVADPAWAAWANRRHGNRGLAVDRKGQIIGMVVFVLGIVILLFVFGVAYGMFSSSGARPVVPSAGLERAVLLVLVRVTLLFVMTLAGSLIASRGIELYLGSRLRPAESREPEQPHEG